MTVETKTFPTRKVMKREKLKMNQLGFRSLHTNFIDNKFEVVFVNGSDDPANSEEAEENKLRFKLEKLLIETIENDTITFDDYKILMRLERNLELKQSTVDKLILVRQGGLSGILQRIRNLFNL